MEPQITLPQRPVRRIDNLFKQIEMMMDRYEKMLSRLPVIADWVEHKGETVVIMPNYLATKKANKPMVDVSYCMTRALNCCVLYTVQWDKRKFKPSSLATTKWNEL